jgi:cytosine/adenosine deaminase-related metal-dependent hydrolase
MAYYNDEFYNKVAPNFSEFVTKLEKLSKKYGVAIHGHYDLTDDPKEFKNIRYTRDYTSGDIRAEGYWEE